MKLKIQVAKAFRKPIEGAGVVAKNAKVVAIEGYETIRVEVNPDPSLGMSDESRSEAEIRPLVAAAFKNNEWKQRSKALARRWQG